MAKYLMLRELDPARVPVDPKQRATGWAALMAMVKNEIAEGGETEIAIMTASSFQETVPFCFITSPSVKDPQGEHAVPGRHTIELFTYINYSIFEK